MTKYYFILYLLLNIPNYFFGQNIFEFKDFINIVMTNHPVIKQCDIILKNAENKLIKSKGEYDPVISSSVSRKEIDKNIYYNLFEGNLKIPIWSGIEFNTGINQNYGNFVNPNDYINSNQLWYSGITIPVGSNLIIDSRLAEIKKSKEIIKLSVEEIKLIKNNLIYDAIKRYWSWSEKFNDFKIYEEFVDLSYNRFLAVREGYLSGDLASIDSLESFILYQTRLYNKSQYEKEYNNESILLSNFLWTENEIPLEITSKITPPSYTILLNHPDLHVDTNLAIINQMIDLHPEIISLDQKIKVQEINRKLSKENLKPNLNLKYNFLSANADINQLNFNNYRMGVNFRYSLFLRKERSDLKLFNLKIRDLEYEKVIKRLALLNQTKHYINELIFTENQADILENITENYSNLLKGERLKFDAGESSVFLMNSRESKLIESKLTLVNLKVKAITYDYGIDWSLCILNK
jgi:outer membrane protein TolC